jgi:FAD/FMN-containing dehydrogenase
VATALKWAGGHNIRVIVKGTGHSYTGRSIGYGSLSIWTHNLRGIQYLEEFTPTRCPIPNPLSAVRVAAGHTGEEIQFYLAEYNKVVVTGANPSVGIIGWLTGGGHGYLSSTYGLGSDNLLEATVVLPSGETILTNPCQNGDIFFALRGGGGGTYGVVTRVVLKTYPSPKTTMHVFALTSLPATPEIPFWATIGYLHAEMQRLKDGGMQGYYYIVGPPAYPTLSLLWVFMLFDKPQNTVETLMAPIEAYLAERKGLFAYTSNATHGATYISLAQYIESESVASGSSTYGSRLLSPASLSDANRTANTLARIGPSRNASTPNVFPSPSSFYIYPLHLPNDAQGPISNPILIGHMIAPSSALPSYYPSSSSLNPAWRNALVHLVVVQGWPDDTPASRVKDVYEDITTKTGVLRTLSPETGAYFNEANANEVDWEGSFFGQNYGSLRAIKRYVDPGDVLWCRRCVGSEALVEGDEGQLCRARNEEVADSEEPELR